MAKKQNKKTEYNYAVDMATPDVNPSYHDTAAEAKKVRKNHTSASELGEEKAEALESESKKD